MRATMTKCLGIDTRTNWVEDEDEFTLIASSNLVLLPGGQIKTRPGIRRLGALDAASKGLYGRGGDLHAAIATAAPGGPVPTNFSYDVLTGASSAVGDVLATESWGVDATTGPYGVILIRNVGGQNELHWLKNATTRVTVPFTPGDDIIKAKNKIVVPDPLTGQFRYCSSVDGPDNWLALSDAGFENAVEFTFGSRQITGFGVHQGLLAVFYADGVQFWTMDEDPAYIGLQQFKQGIGTSSPQSAANVQGDLVFLSPSGFTEMATATVTGQADGSNIGDRIRDLTAALGVNVEDAKAVWHERGQQYLCAIRGQVFVWHVFPRDQWDAWMLWDLPYPVDALTELEGEVYFRSGNDAFQFDDSIVRDYGATADIAWSMETRPFSFGKAAGLNKIWRRFGLQLDTGNVTVIPIVDGLVKNRSALRFRAAPGPQMKTMAGAGVGRAIALRVSGTGAFAMSGALLEADPCAQ